VIGLISCVIFLIGIGVFFALPTYIPVLRHRVRQSTYIRTALIFSLSIIAFIVSFMMTTYLMSVILRYANDGTCTYISGLSDCGFFQDTLRDALVEREVWLQTMTPPFLLDDNTCFTGDRMVCEFALQYRWDMFFYIVMVQISSISAISCGLMVRFITRDRRKEKRKSDTP